MFQRYHQRMHQVRLGIQSRLSAFVAALASEREELTVLLGILLVAGGVWTFSHGLALMVAGGILLWIALPQRAPFIVRPTIVQRARRQDEDS